MNFLSAICIVGTLSLCMVQMTMALPAIKKMDDIAQMLPNTVSSRIQEEPVDVNSHVNEDWLKTALDGIASYVVSTLSNPNNIEEERKYLKIARIFIEPLVEYSDNVNLNNKVTSKILHALKVFLSLLEEKVNGNIVGKHTFAETN